MIQPNTHKCNTANVVVTIKSAADHFGEFLYRTRKYLTLHAHSEHRAAIRESWASMAQNETIIVFLLGRPVDSGSSETMVQISDEAAKYSDILLGDYADTYANLTLKEC